MNFVLTKTQIKEIVAENKNTEKTVKGDRIITLYISDNDYNKFDQDIVFAREIIMAAMQADPELFPDCMHQHFKFNGHTQCSKKSGIRLRLIRSGAFNYRIYPHFMFSYMRGKTQEISSVLFLCRWAPYWALSEVFGRDAMYWYRCHNSLSRKSLVGCTVQKNTVIPEDIVADEHHSKQNKKKVYVCTTVAQGCFLGAQVSKSSDHQGLMNAYGKFKEEVLLLEPEYTLNSVNLDGWKAGQSAWRELFSGVTIIVCFLHAFIRIRDRALKKLKSEFDLVSDKVWECYRAENKRSFSQRVRRLRKWAEDNMSISDMKSNVLRLCNRSKIWQEYYAHPNSYRTSNMLDRLMRFMDRHLEKNQGFHGASEQVATKSIRAFALIYNFTPSCPDKKRNIDGFKSPVERLNQSKYHDDWLVNLLIAGSLNGKRSKPLNRKHSANHIL